MKYSDFVHGLSTQNVQLNRKVLSELAMHEPYSFKSLVEVAKKPNEIRHHSQL